MPCLHGEIVVFLEKNQPAPEVKMTHVLSVLNPPILWRYWLVYYRYPDDRVMFFRGKRRKSLYIQNMTCGKNGDWTWEEDFARLFQSEPIITTASTSKRLVEKEDALMKMSYRGYDGYVLQTHLILPRG